MFEALEVEADDAKACAAGLVGSLMEQRMAAASRFAWVARWARLHEPDDVVRREGLADARRRTVWQVSTDGIPDVTMAGVAELGVLLQTSTRSAENLLRDVLEVEFRLPSAWHAVMTGKLEDWKARELAKITRPLTVEQAKRVDGEVVDAMVGLPWGRALSVIHGKVIAIDPEGHEARLKEDDARRFVSTRRRSNAFGLRTMVARGAAGDIARLEAMVAHLADQMEAAGDEDPLDTRRAKALALLANPAMACAFLVGMLPSTAGTTDNPEAELAEDPEVDEPLPGMPDEDPVEATPPSAVELAREFGKVLQRLGKKAIDRLRPKSVIYIHLSDAALKGYRGTQVARVENAVAAGPIGVDQLREWLKNDRVVVKPVLDPLLATAADGYEVSDGLKEAQALLTPFEIFPYGTQPARQTDEDHTKPYRLMSEGGPPGQTAIGNLGPLGRTHHLVKTFCGFEVHQPSPGLYYWRTPTGWWYQVDHRGTRPLGRDRPACLERPLVVELDERRSSTVEQLFREQISLHSVS